MCGEKEETVAHICKYEEVQKKMERRYQRGRFGMKNGKQLEGKTLYNSV